MDSLSVVSPKAEEPVHNASIADWVAVAAGSLGALLATLDISITNSALPQIQGQIGANGTEGTWIATGYLMSEIVMIPLAAWLSRVFGLRRFLMWNAVLFIGFSMLCGLSESLVVLVIGRIGQGFAGGAMIPTAQTIVRTRLPQHQMPLGMSVFGLVVLLGPLLGPVFGGWLTEYANWRWCFFINFPVAVALILLLFIGLPPERSAMRLFYQADWLGIVGLAIGLSSLTVMLEEGQREQWFESSVIVSLSLIAIFGSALVFIGQCTANTPIMSLRLLLNRNYASVIVIVFALGMGLYGVSYLLPQFLGTIAGYNALQAGSIMLLSGLPAFLMMPFLPRILGKIDVRWPVVLGLVCFFASCMLDTSLTTQSVGSDFTASQILRGVGQIFVMMPLNQAAMATVAIHQAGDAAGLYNMARNLGGSVGLALLGVIIDRRSAYHDAVIRESFTANNLLAQEYLSATAAPFLNDGGDALHARSQATAQLAYEFAQQAAVMTYSDTFYIVGTVLVCCIPLALLLKRSAGTEISTAGH